MAVFLEYYSILRTTIQIMASRLAQSKLQLICDKLKSDELLNVSQMADVAECSFSRFIIHMPMIGSNCVTAERS
jgi:hypothetical protein